MEALDEIRLVHKGQFSELLGRLSFELNPFVVVQGVLKFQAICTEEEPLAGVAFSGNFIPVVADNSVACIEQVPPNLVGPSGDGLDANETDSPGPGYSSNGQAMAIERGTVPCTKATYRLVTRRCSKSNPTARAACAVFPNTTHPLVPKSRRWHGKALPVERLDSKRFTT